MVTLNLLGLNTGSTCSKLHDLHKELNQQIQGATEAYGRPILNQLLKLLDSKDKQVKILNCCCIADIFRIYAPEAPFTEKELQQIFSAFFKQLTFIKDPNGPLFSYYFYLLETISTIKCVCLLGDLRSADDLIGQLFSDFFDIIRSDMTMTLQVCMRDVLYQLIEEFPFINQGVVELIVSHFSSKSQKSNPSSFRLAADLCNMCDDKLQRYVCQYFSDVMIAASKDLEDEETFQQFQRSHELIMEIFERVPSLLLNVVPQLEEELKVENETIRQLATDSLGKMFSKKGSKWVDTYPQIFKTWCDRRNDKNNLIRVDWVVLTGSIVQHHPDMTQTMEPMLKSKLLDPDEKVRVAALHAIGLVCQEHPNLLDDETFKEVANRCRDKKLAPRNEAIQVLSKLFNHVYNLSLQTSDAPLERFMWIPGSILELLYLDDLETRIIVEKVLVESLFPPNTDHTVRATRILRVLSDISEKQRQAFLMLLDRQVKAITSFSTFIDYCIKYNSPTGQKDPEIKEILKKVIDFLAKQLPDPKKGDSHLLKFAELKDGRLFKLVRAVMDPLVDYKSLLKHNKEICSTLGKHGNVLDTLAIFLRRISLSVINKNLMEVLFGMIKNGKGNKTAELLVKDISRIFPALYKNNISSFFAIIGNKDSKNELVGDTVEALAKFVKAYPTFLSSEKELSQMVPKLVDRLVQLCLSGTAKQAKNAAIVLALTGHTDECRSILAKITRNVSLDFATLVPKLACMKSLAFYCNTVYAEFSAEIINLIVSKILMKNVLQGDGSESGWTPFETLEDEGKAKILGLKILVKPLLIESENGAEDRLDVAKSIMKLCRALLSNDGELLSSGITMASFKAHLRLNAGLAALKLLAIKDYGPAFEPDDFNKIGLLIQDSAYYVRSKFVERLIDALFLDKIKIGGRCTMWLTLAAHEPELALRNRAKNALMRLAKVYRAVGQDKQRGLLESFFSDFCQLVSHHPDFSMEKQDLESIEGYIQFYLDTVVSAENISYLYATACQLKMVKDKLLTDSTPLYVVAEMLILRIREFCAQHNWTLDVYPGKYTISRDFYARMSDDEISLTLKTVYYKDGDQRLQKALVKRQVTSRPAAVAAVGSSDEDGASSGDSDETQFERKRDKLSSSKGPAEPVRRSKRAKVAKRVTENADEVAGEEEEGGAIEKEFGENIAY